ncbi:MAG: hypothetical protein NVS9B5_37900 [Terriglobales bacterium]
MSNAFDQVSRSLLPKVVADLQQKVFDIAREEIEPLAKAVDAERKWPHILCSAGEGGLDGSERPERSGWKG